MMEVLQTVGLWAAWILVWALCAAGVLVSCLSLSGSWLVTAAAAGAALLRPDRFPGWETVAVFAVCSAAVEAAEWLAGAWGVTRRGGSRGAGAAAVAGGLAGMIAGGIVLPMPLLGSLVGMMAGSFAAAFAVEHHRLQHAGRAADIAWGAVAARVAVLLLKVATAMALSGWLVFSVWRG